MKINVKKATTKIVSTIGIILLLISLAYSAVAYTNGFFPFETRTDTKDASSLDLENINYNKPTDEQKAAGEDQKQFTATPKEEPTTDTPVEDTPLEVTITVLTQNNNLIQIRALIGLVTNDGICTLTLTKGNTIVVKTSGMQSLPSESTCKGFDVETSELATGEWNATVTADAETLTGVATQSFTVQ